MVMYYLQDDDPMELYAAFKDFFHSIEGTSRGISVQEGGMHEHRDLDIEDSQEDEDQENEQWEDTLESACT